MKIERIILADNQPITAYAIEHLAREKKDNLMVEYASNYSELLRLVRESNQNTAIFLDYTLFDFQSQEQLTILADNTNKYTIWLLVSDELTSNFLKYVLYNTENIGVVYKDADINTLRTAVGNTMDGMQYISQQVTQTLLRKASKEEQHKDDLTQTEREVLRLIVQGKTTKEIAAERFSSINTINSHRKNIFRKLNVNCVHDAMKYAIRSGLVEESEFYI